jgi:hypothetical protein
MKIKYLVPILLIVFIFSFTACKTTPAAATTAAAQTTQPADTTTQPAITTAAVDEKKYSASREFDSSDGYKYLETFTVWEPITGSNGALIYHPFNNAFSVSDYDPVKDMVIPLMISIKNTTVGFDSPQIGTHLLFWPVLCDDPGLIDYLKLSKIMDVITYQYNYGTKTNKYSLVYTQNSIFTQGDELMTGLPGNTWNPIPSGATAYSLFFVIIHDYITPASPDGNKALLDYIAVGPGHLMNDGVITLSGTVISTAETATTAGAETTESESSIPETTAASEKANYNIGDTGPAGGLIFYLNPNYKSDGWKYLEAAPNDSPGDNNNYFIPWNNGDFVKTGATETAIGTGKANTQKIVDIQGNGSYAAKLCSDLTQGGYSDWFLPSKDELNLI